MSAALAVVRRDADVVTNCELGEKLMAGYTTGGSRLVGGQYRDEFGWQAVEGYEKAAGEAHARLWGLKRIVDDIDREAWPRMLSRPVEPI